MYPERVLLTCKDLKKMSAKTILHFMCLIERVHTYGLPFGTILSLQVHFWMYVAGPMWKRGGGGERGFVALHTNNATHKMYSTIWRRRTTYECLKG